MSISADIEAELFRLRDDKYAEFQQKLTPTLGREHFIGVRTPELKKLARVLAGRSDAREFLSALPHRYFEEDQLHAFILSEEKDFSRCIAMTEAFIEHCLIILEAESGVVHGQLVFAPMGKDGTIKE